MIKDFSVEKINSRIDRIITRALLITSDEQESDPLNIYHNTRLYDLVLEPIAALCLEKVDLETRNLFFSEIGNIRRCTKLLKPGDDVYSCQDCAVDETSIMCEECFMNSVHVKHHFVQKFQTLEFFCSCGDSKAYTNSGACCKHRIQNNSRTLPEIFVRRIKNIIRHLFKYLELLLGDEALLDAYVTDKLLMNNDLVNLDPDNNPKGFFSRFLGRWYTTNTHKSCLLIFKPDREKLDYATSCAIFANPPIQRLSLLNDFEISGYSCLLNRASEWKCKVFSFIIQKCIRYNRPGSGLQCRVMKVYRIFFMKLSTVLINFIHVTCLKKSQLCDLVSEILFNRTTLHQQLFFNKSLWKDIRYNLVHHIILPTVFSRTGGLNLVKFYTEIFGLSYSLLLVDNSLQDYLYTISIHLAKSRTLFTRLVEYGLLCSILDFVSCMFKRCGFRNGTLISEVYNKFVSSNSNTIHAITTDFGDMLYVYVDGVDLSVLTKSELKKAAIRLVKFCADFDDMEPLILRNIPQEYEINSDGVAVAVSTLRYVCQCLVACLMKFDGISNLIIREFLKAFKKDLNRILEPQLSTREAIERLITLHNIESKPFSIFNLSQRLFFYTLTKCVIKGTLSNKLKKVIFNDQRLLIWISKAAIISLSVEMSFKAGRLMNPSNHLVALLSMYHKAVMAHNFFVPDFCAIQFLISFVCPEDFLKYVLFNICPSIREKTSVSQPLASILSLSEFKDSLALQQVLILIYNALTELRLDGSFKDSDSYFVEREDIVNLVSECKKYLRNYSCLDSDTSKSHDQYSNFTNYDESFFEFYNALLTRPKKGSRRIFPKYLNPGTPFHYLNTIEDTKYIFESLISQYKIRVPNFLLPDVTTMKGIFKGMDDFTFSETFMEFIMQCFVIWYQNPDLWKKDSPDLLLLILLIICLILRVSKDGCISDLHRKRMLDFFGPHPKLANRSLYDIIKDERPNSENPLVASMMDRFIDLVHIEQRK
ncbi:E3 ubiquitin-protein ligase UBR1 [Thelohanellus kitauei]|uniref:E3 ubiquitin-protein ligase n=1 Tax=Thelohanellus kitauei TaxID=669202 RepID=A0A0C2NKJ4_THEKT|nr:E3 ubiquitin-protein ligase UBR1 [Thelohanellus kitauei]